MGRFSDNLARPSDKNFTGLQNLSHLTIEINP